MTPSRKGERPQTSASGRVRPATASGKNVTRSSGGTQERGRAVWLSLGAFVLLALAAWLVLARQHGGAQLATHATPRPFEGVAYSSQGHQGHQPGDLKRYAHFHYSSDPPTSGFHREIFTSKFVETKPIPKYVQVHLLEHGNVLLQYNCFCPSVVSALSRIADEFDSRVIAQGAATASLTDVRNAEEQGIAVVVAPYPGMPTPVALTAWTRLGTLHDADEAKIISFINLYLHNTDNLSR